MEYRLFTIVRYNYRDYNSDTSDDAVSEASGLDLYPPAAANAPDLAKPSSGNQCP
jgi:hypothetical protein